MDNNEKKHVKIGATRFLMGSFVLLICFSVGVFAFLGSYMSRESERTIDDLGNMYMSSMGERISKHFETIINLRLSQAEAVVTVVSSEGGDMGQIYDELIYRTEVRDFASLALCAESGEMEILYGEGATLIDPDSFLKSLRKGERKVAVAADDSGEQIVLFGVNAHYPMSNGEESIAAVMGVPAQYINDELALEREDIEMYAHIIREDGTFVIRDKDIEYADYQGYVRALYADDTEAVDLYIEDLLKTLKEGRDYFAILEFGGGRLQVITVALPNSEWNLVIVLPFGVLNESVQSLNEERTIATLLACGAILLMLLLIFFQYYRISIRQINELNEARKTAEEATKAKSEFLSNMSHDIRTPMNAIVGFTSLAMKHIDNRERMEEYLKKIMTSGNHLLSLINDVLDMSRIESGKIRLDEKACSLPEILHSICNIVQADVHAKQLELHIDTLDIRNEDIYCDKLRLNQVLLNLLGNAVKYTGAGGAINMRITEKAGAPDGFAQYEFSIKDNGVGMSDEFVEHIFEPFEREKNSTTSGIQGTGLGMAITKNIVDMMNGTIEVESELGVGSTFTVSFVFRTRKEEKEEQAIPELKNCRALVVDDDFNTCDSVSYMLGQIGLRAEWTLSGKEAVLRTKQASMRKDGYLVYIIDWLLPDMNGIEVTRRVRQVMGDNVPVIVLTAYDWSEIEEEAKEAGVTAFCSKPLFMSELRKCLRTVIGAEEQVEEEKEGREVQFKAGRILLAEDNELNQEIAVEILGGAGFTTEVAENGKVALEMLQRSDPGYYQLVLMDVQMPVMSGYEAVREIRQLENQRLAGIPVIAMTANAFEEDKQEALRNGMDGHIAKPINIELLFTTLNKVLSREKCG